MQLKQHLRFPALEANHSETSLQYSMFSKHKQLEADFTQACQLTLSFTTFHNPKSKFQSFPGQKNTVFQPTKS